VQLSSAKDRKQLAGVRTEMGRRIKGVSLHYDISTADAPYIGNGTT